MQYFIITSTVTDIYNEPHFTSSVVTQSLFGESNIILDKSENWLRVRLWDGYEGWVHSFYGISSDEPYESNFLSTNLFEKIKNSEGRTLKQLIFGSSIHVENGKVILPDGSIGIYNSIDSFKHLGRSRDQIVLQAQEFLGTPYKWGGRSSFGLDCSGLVQTVFRSVGLNLPRDSYQQSDFLGEKNVEIDDLEKGDLIFFAEELKITHVAISLGGPEFIHSQGEVKINSFAQDSNKYSKKLSEMNVAGKSINSLLRK